MKTVRATQDLHHDISSWAELLQWEMPNLSFSFAVAYVNANMCDACA